MGPAGIPNGAKNAAEPSAGSWGAPAAPAAVGAILLAGCAPAELWELLGPSSDDSPCAGDLAGACWPAHALASAGGAGAAPGIWGMPKKEGMPPPTAALIRAA